MDYADLMDEVVRLLGAAKVPYCVIGGQGVNAYVEPLVSLDLDLVVTATGIDPLLAALSPRVKVERFPYFINVSAAGSDLRVQLQLDPRYADFPKRASEELVLGRRMSVAAVQDRSSSASLTSERRYQPNFSTACSDEAGLVQDCGRDA